MTTTTSRRMRRKRIGGGDLAGEDQAQWKCPFVFCPQNASSLARSVRVLYCPVVVLSLFVCLLVLYDPPVGGGGIDYPQLATPAEAEGSAVKPVRPHHTTTALRSEQRGQFRKIPYYCRPVPAAPRVMWASYRRPPGTQVRCLSDFTASAKLAWGPGWRSGGSNDRPLDPPSES